MIKTTADLLMILESHPSARLVDHNHDQRWLVLICGHPKTAVSDKAAEAAILEGWIEDLSEDGFDEPIYALTEAGRVALSRAIAEARRQRKARRPSAHKPRPRCEGEIRIDVDGRILPHQEAA